MQFVHIRGLAKGPVEGGVIIDVGRSGEEMGGERPGSLLNHRSCSVALSGTKSLLAFMVRVRVRVRVRGGGYVPQSKPRWRKVLNLWGGAHRDVHRDPKKASAPYRHQTC